MCKSTNNLSSRLSSVSVELALLKNCYLTIEYEYEEAVGRGLTIISHHFTIKKALESLVICFIGGKLQWFYVQGAKH